ncbi:CBN-LIPS-7 protein, partial [Aphelenchoides avenae]
RTDLAEEFGEWGSFGGGEHTAGVRTGKIAVIFVHGMGGRAFDMRGNREYLLGTNQYSDPEIYATSWGKGDSQPDILRCEYIKHVRQLIVAVYQFSGSQRVNVIADLHGVPISRKAILGGKCVDTGEDLGPSLTNSVQKYVSLGGPNRGYFYCAVQNGLSPGDWCNNVTGVAPDSTFLRDINSKVHYEGQETYAVLSTVDGFFENPVGYNYNGIILTRLPGADKTYAFDELYHGDVNSKTYPTQYEILTSSAPSVFGCASTNLTDVLRQKLLDFHNGFRSNVAKGVAIVNPSGQNFTFPTAKDMFKVKYSCELEEHANSRAQQCTYQPSAANNAAGVTLAGGYYRIAGGHAGNFGSAFYDTFRKWLWEFYNQRDSTAPLTTYNGFEGAQFLIHNNLEIGCAIRQDCWLDMDGDGTVDNKTQVVVCAYRNRASVASEVYPRGPACTTDADCTYYPATCLASYGLCDLKSQPPPFGQLSVNGNKLVGEFGQRVRLRGMSFFGTNMFNRDRFYKIETVSALKCSWRTNVVRAVINTGTNGTWVPDPALPPKPECATEPNNCGGGYIYHTRQQFRQPEGNVDLRIFEKVVKSAIEVGMYVIIDWHNE